MLAIAVDGDEMVAVELGHLDEAKRRLGDKMDIVLAKDSGRGHAALQHEVGAYAPKINQVLKSLD